MSLAKTAMEFFQACETGKGGAVCAQWCHDDAGFSCQSDALAEMTALSDYADWVKGLQGPIPDGDFEIKAFASDEARGRVVAAAVFSGTNTGEGGPVPPTGNYAATDYVYVMEFEGDKIRHMTKIWNDGIALRMLGWA